MPHFLTRESPALITTALVEALDLVDFGILMLSPDLTVRFVNRRQREIWMLNLLPEKDQVTFRDVLEHVAEQGLYPLAPEDRRSFIDVREEEVRNPSGMPRTLDLSDGRRFVISCRVTPENGRILTYVEETAVRQCEIREQTALEDAQRRDAEVRFHAELMESHSAQLASLAEAAEEAAVRAIEANNRLEQEVKERSLLMSELQRIATTDQLTGLINRGQFINLANGIVQDARLHFSPAAVIMVDIDHFKSINDQHGHAVGDAVLRIVSERLNGTLHSSDVLGRLGGEEFAVVIPTVSDDTAEAIAERLRLCVAEHAIRAGDYVLRVTISLGTTMLQPCDSSIDAALARADGALYRAKRSGRNRVCAWIPSMAAAG